MTGRVHILRVGNRYRLVFIPSGPGRHLVEGEGALRNFLLTDLEIPPDATETAIGELDRSGRHTIENILVTDRTRKFWPLDTTPPPTAPEANPAAPALSKPAHAKAAPSRSTAAARQTQINEESETEGPFGPMKGAPWDRKCPRRYLVRTAGNQCDS